jgi:hypothetical protein
VCVVAGERHPRGSATSPASGPKGLAWVSWGRPSWTRRSRSPPLRRCAVAASGVVSC